MIYQPTKEDWLTQRDYMKSNDLWVQHKQVCTAKLSLFQKPDSSIIAKLSYKLHDTGFGYTQLHAKLVSNKETFIGNIRTRFPTDDREQYDTIYTVLKENRDRDTAKLIYAGKFVEDISAQKKRRTQFSKPLQPFSYILYDMDEATAFVNHHGFQHTYGVNPLHQWKTVKGGAKLYTETYKWSDYFV